MIFAVEVAYRDRDGDNITSNFLVNSEVDRVIYMEREFEDPAAFIETLQIPRISVDANALGGTQVPTQIGELNLAIVGFGADNRNVYMEIKAGQTHLLYTAKPPFDYDTKVTHVYYGLTLPD